MIVIDIEDDIREFYRIDAETEDVQLNNVSLLQNQSSTAIPIIVDGRRWFVNPFDSVMFQAKVSVILRKTTKHINFIIGVE